MSKIMVVDDEPAIVKVVTMMLEREGHEVTSAYSGEEALEKLKMEKPDLVLLDIMMPGLDGWETCRRIKEGQDTKDIIVAMLTVLDMDDSKKKSFQFSKADAHMTKPMNKDKIVGTIEWLLKNKPGKDMG